MVPSKHRGAIPNLLAKAWRSPLADECGVLYYRRDDCWLHPHFACPDSSREGGLRRIITLRSLRWRGEYTFNWKPNHQAQARLSFPIPFLALSGGFLRVARDPLRVGLAKLPPTGLGARNARIRPVSKSRVTRPEPSIGALNSPTRGRTSSPAVTVKSRRMRMVLQCACSLASVEAPAGGHSKTRGADRMSNDEAQ